jgi:hypothetical protein
MPLHRHEITVVMIPGGASGQVRIQKRHDSVPAQSTFIARGTFLTRCTVKDLEQNEIADQQRFPAGGCLRPYGCRRSLAPQMADPDSTVDKDHDRRVARPPTWLWTITRRRLRYWSASRRPPMCMDRSLHKHRGGCTIRMPDGMVLIIISRPNAGTQRATCQACMP